jgi:uncharacterized tellurite resistance protein B-like protein
MLDAIKSFFSSSMAPPDGEEELGDEDLRLAACALLIELAYADDEFTEDERRHLTSAVRRQYGLDEEHAEALINLAELARREAVDLYQFTKLIKANYSLGQKLVLMEVMWVLVYADGDLSSDEEALLRKVCHLLNLSPGYLADVKKRVEISRDPKDQDAHPSQQESN